ncbi:MAG: hypothetical protein IJR55_06125 [Clostridia bacterium]|nr:hypothetical protein [Clostridia bacterium]
MEFIKSHIVEILLSAAAVVCAFILIKRGYKQRAKDILLSLVAAAERKWGAGTGEIKFSSVIGAIYEKLPFVKLFLSEKTLSTLIEDAVDALKKYLYGESNEKNGDLPY